MGGSLDLKQFGLDSIELDKLFDSEQKANRVNGEAKPVNNKPEIVEADCLYDKSYECPVCKNSFKEKTVRKAKVRLISQDIDLHLRQEPLDCNKYEVVVCNNCGYARIDKYFKSIGTISIAKIQSKISSRYRPFRKKGDTYSYEDALARYNLALANAYAIGVKSSEKAMICLKTAWIIREIKERTAEADSEKIAELTKKEKEYLKLALEGFSIARSTEAPPICNLDDISFDYLLAALMFENDDINGAYKLLYNIIVSKSIGRVQKNKAEILFDKIKKLKHEKNE